MGRRGGRRLMATKKAPKYTTKAISLLNDLVQVNAAIETARKKAGLPALEASKDALKSELTALMIQHSMEQVGTDGAHATLVQATYGGKVLATSEDFRDLDEIPTDRPIMPLREIIKMKFGAIKAGSKSLEIWKRVTKPVVRMDALDEVVSEGLLTVDEIAPAYIEKQKRPYVRVFND